MDTAKRYIENMEQQDLELFLPRINGIDIFIKCGITLFVNEFGPNYTDMTLIQYAIAKRKPDALNKLLAMACDYQIKFEEIISPKTSNTKQNLINLAIEFGSINPDYGYNKFDKTCLEVVLNFAKNAKEKKNENFDIDMENINGETPLFTAINFQNTEACKSLISNGADLFHKSKANPALETPLRHLLKKAANQTILLNILERDILGEDIYNSFLNEIKSDEFEEFKKEIHSDSNIKFIDSLIKNDISRKDTCDKKDPNERTDTESSEPKKVDNVIKCSKCGNPVETNKIFYNEDDEIICNICYAESLK